MPEHADLIVTNARILTMDEGSPRAEAIAVRGGMVVAVGSANSVASLPNWRCCALRKCRIHSKIWTELQK